MTAWQNQDGYDIDDLDALNGNGHQVKAVGLMLGPKSGGILAVDFDGPPAAGKFEEVYGRHPQELPETIGVTSGKEKRGQLLFLVDQTGGPHYVAVGLGRIPTVTPASNCAGLAINPSPLARTLKPRATAG